MLELRSLTKKFGITTAVRDLSITCEDKEFLVIFGPAGAGKTTTLRLVSGILQPTSGEVYFNGKSLRNVSPEDRNMSMVFENYALYSHLTVYENLAFPLRAKRLKEDEIRTRVHAMADILQISGLLDRRPGFLSGGQRQRVALGRALVREADVYLLDEPISHLDAKLRHSIRVELKAICADKEATVVHVTHDYREAMALSDRVAVINKGRLLQLGPPREVFHRPANEFVAGFFGDPPMSFIDVEYAEERGTPFLRVIDNGTRLSVSHELKDKVNRIALPNSMRIGVRANALSAGESEDENHHVPAEAFVTETLGFRNILIANVGKNQVRVITSPDQSFETKQRVWLDLNETNMHVFADGKTIAHPKFDSN